MRLEARAVTPGVAHKLAKEIGAKPTKPKKGDTDFLKALERRRAVMDARSSLIGFTRMTMPDVMDPDDHEKSRFMPVAHHKLIAEKLEAVERGEILRLIVTMPPRHGKSELCSRRFIPWAVGRDPTREVIFTTYNQTFAESIGSNVRGIFALNQYAQIFPEAVLRSDSRSKERMDTTEGGVLAFSGVGGSQTGMGAHIYVIDDPFKNREEAESETIREAVWDWFRSVAYTRLMPGGAMVIILTRWHEDDLVGRLLDPKQTSEEIAAEWEVLSLPALAEEDDPMGREVGDALWPERYPTKVLNNIRKVIGPRDWASLYQQHPTPEDGDFFTKEMFTPYQQDELPDPEDMATFFRFYGASDHAVGKRQVNDRSCIGTVGIDHRGDIWIMPDIDWSRMAGDEQVDAMIRQMKTHRPTVWWAEKGQISASIGPYLRKQMMARSVSTWLQEKTPTADKRARAQSIRARAALRPIKVPAYMAWWGKALSECLSFPNGRHDDFVDWLAWIGLGLELEHGGAVPTLDRPEGPKVGSGSWVIMQAKAEQRAKKLSNKRQGW